MKRIVYILLVAIMILAMAACAQTRVENPGSAAGNVENTPGDNMTGAMPVQEQAVTLKAKVMEIKGDAFLAANMAEGANGADIYWINTDKIGVLNKNGGLADIGELKNGMLIDIVYNGVVMESFPMQLGGIKSIRIREEGNDIVGLYMQVIKDLYEVDPGLNSDIERLAFNLNDVTNLTEPEKTALVYMTGNEFGLETLRGTFEELREQGYIAKDQLYFETGLLYTIEVKSEEKDSFVFDAQKWRAGDGAYYFLDCTANKQKDGWSYTIGGQAIS